MKDCVHNGVLSVSEIFNSIQGEGLYSGRPCTFIRLTGCNLRCTWCDTKYAYSNGSEMAYSEIVDNVMKFNCNLIEITGGEPLLQSNIYDLISELNFMGKKILLETNGSLPIDNVPDFVHIIMDIKTPSSNGFSNASIENIKFLKRTDEIKIIVESYGDFEWIMKLTTEYKLSDYLENPIILQPVFGILAEKELGSWILNSGRFFKLGIQLHKYIYGENVIGV